MCSCSVLKVYLSSQAIFPCVKELWKSPQLAKLSPKVVELLLSTASHFFRSEDIIEHKLSVYFMEDDEDFIALLQAANRAANAENTTGDTAGGEAGTSSGGAAATSGTTSTTGTAGTAGTTGTTGTTGATGTTDTTSASGTAGGAAGGEASESSSSVRPPRVDPLYLGQLCDMGFSREQAERALLVCGNDLTTAMEWLLTRHPSGGEVRRACVCVCVCVYVCVCVLVPWLGHTAVLY